MTALQAHDAAVGREVPIKGVLVRARMAPRIVERWTGRVHRSAVAGPAKKPIWLMNRLTSVARLTTLLGQVTETAEHATSPPARA